MTSSTPEAVAVYEAYPRHVAKPKALRAIIRAINLDGFDFVMEKTKAYARRCLEAKEQFIPYPATFYNQQRYMDDLKDLIPLKAPKVHELRAIIAAKTVIRDKLRVKHRYESPTGFSWNNEEARLKAQQLSSEINDLTEKLASMA